jgi:hypothetical protein
MSEPKLKIMRKITRGNRALKPKKKKQSLKVGEEECKKLCIICVEKNNQPKTLLFNLILERI